MQTDVAIIGGGLSGLSLARHLEDAGTDYIVFEARDRFGGRIFTESISQAAINLGPSWFWPGQHRMERLVKEWGLATFTQYSSGGAVFEHPDGRVESVMRFASMQGSWLLVGGTCQIIQSLLATLPRDRLLTGHAASRITQAGEISFANGTICKAKRIVLALPSRVAATMAFDPALPQEALQAMEAIPTWMAGHAKLFATYKEPFWREQGLSGEGFSRRGPLAEIHDTSPADSNASGALFGFLGVPAQQRRGHDEAVIKACLAQLGRMFGEIACEPFIRTGP